MKTQFEATIVQHRDDAANDPASTLQRDRTCALVGKLELALAGAIAALIGWLAATSEAGAPVLGALVLLVAAAGFGGLKRRAGARAHTARTDHSVALYNRGGLIAHGEALLASCRRDRRDLTLAVFDCSDLLEARVIYGSNTNRALIDCIVSKLTLLAGNQGLAARTGPAQFAVAMPMARDRAARAIERALGNPCRIELERGDSEIVLVPNLMVETVPRTATLEKLFCALCRGLARVQDEEKTRLRYLQRERERHSRTESKRQRPGAAAAPHRTGAARREPEEVNLYATAGTVPMPLTARQGSAA